jgi:hypothetical protein
LVEHGVETPDGLQKLAPGRLTASTINRHMRRVGYDRDRMTRQPPAVRFHPKLKNDLRRPQMEEIGDRTTVFEFGGLRDRQRDYIDWVLKISLDEGVTPEDIMTDAAATRLAAKLKTPLQIGQHLVRAFEAGFEVGAKPVDEPVVEAVLSLRIDDLEPRLTRSGYDVRSLVEQFDAKPAEIRRLLRGDLDPARSRELLDEMRAAGLPT